MEPRKYDFVEVTLEPDDYEKVKEVYRLHKEQANKLFSLSSGVSSDEDIMQVIKNDIENNIKSPSLFVMVRLSKALDVEITELYKVKW